MSDTLKLSAETRERVGKGASRALRREGRVPAVIYGNKQEPVSIHLEERALMKMLNTGHFMNSIVMIEGVGRAIRTLPKDVTFDVVTDRPVHVDFLRIAKNATVTVAVPVVFTDEDDAPGIVKGGVLNVVRHELELVVEASNIPESIEVSLKGLDVGDTIHISAVTLPEGSESAIDDRDFTIATIIAPSAMKAEVQEALAEDAALAEAAAAEQQAEVAEAEAEAAAEDGDAEASDETDEDAPKGE